LTNGDLTSNHGDPILMDLHKTCHERRHGHDAGSTSTTLVDLAHARVEDMGFGVFSGHFGGISSCSGISRVRIVVVLVALHQERLR
jgi:hypothetical protein